MATWGPRWGFQTPPPATEPTALKQDFILKILKRTEMLHGDACNRRGGSSRGACAAFPHRMLWVGLWVLSAHLSVGLCVWVCVGVGVCLRETKYTEGSVGLYSSKC